MWAGCTLQVVLAALEAGCEGARRGGVCACVCPAEGRCSPLLLQRAEGCGPSSDPAVPCGSPALPGCAGAGAEAPSELPPLGALPLPDLCCVYAFVCWLMGESFMDVSDLGGREALKAQQEEGGVLRQLGGGELQLSRPSGIHALAHVRVRGRRAGSHGVARGHMRLHGVACAVRGLGRGWGRGGMGVARGALQLSPPQCPRWRMPG